MRRPTFRTMVWRGLRRRCPWCAGRRAFFTGWFAKQPACATCSLRWRRGDVGFELGAAAMAAIITLGPLMAGLGVALVITWPDVAQWPLYVGFGAGAIVLPIVLYPSSYTLWQALDIVMRPVETDHFDVAQILDGTDFDRDADPDSGPTGPR